MKTSMCNISVIDTVNNTKFGMWTPTGTAKSVDASWRHVVSSVCPMLKHSDIYDI